MMAFPHFRAAKPPSAAFSPSDLGTAKLKVWTRPESVAYQTSARSVVESGTGLIGSKDDDSGNAAHLLQANSALRPNRTTPGAAKYSGTTALYTPILGAWAADFAVFCVVKPNVSSASYDRILEVNNASGFYLGWGGPGSNIFNAYLAGTAINSAAQSVGAVHTVIVYRFGTTGGLIVNGGTAITNTVSGSAFTDTELYLGTSPLGAGFDEDIYEVGVVKDATSGDITNLSAYLAARVTAGAYP